MIRGIYIAGTGMLTQQSQLDVIANNLANVNTPGFKRSAVTTEPFNGILMRNVTQGGAPAIGEMPFGVELSGIRQIFEQGPINQTGNTMDLALVGEGYFVVRTPQGNRYTRDGAFQLNGQGQLTTAGGNLVLGVNNQPIQVGAGQFAVSPQGAVTVDGQARGQLQVVNLNPNTIVPAGDSLMQGTPAGAAANTQVRQGALEGSNVSTVTEMVSLIATTRSFEAAQKALTAEDEALGDAVNKVGIVN